MQSGRASGLWMIPEGEMEGMEQEAGDESGSSSSSSPASPRSTPSPPSLHFELMDEELFDILATAKPRHHDPPLPDVPILPARRQSENPFGARTTLRAEAEPAAEAEAEPAAEAAEAEAEPAAEAAEAEAEPLLSGTAPGLPLLPSLASLVSGFAASSAPHSSEAVVPAEAGREAAAERRRAGAEAGREGAAQHKPPLPPPLPRPRFAPSLPAAPPTPPTPPPGPAVITLVTLRAAGAHDWHCAHSSAAQTLVARSVTLRLIAAESAFAGLGDLAHIWVPFPSERILTPPPRHAHLRLPFPARFRNARGTEHEVHTSRYDLCHHGAVGPGSVVQLPRDGVVILDLSWA